jgi:hypothetical protein
MPHLQQVVQRHKTVVRIIVGQFAQKLIDRLGGRNCRQGARHGEEQPSECSSLQRCVGHTTREESLQSCGVDRVQNEH